MIMISTRSALIWTWF